jgi:hypothetical protein
MKPDCIKSAYVSGFFVKNLETEEIKKCKNIMQKVTPTLRDWLYKMHTYKSVSFKKNVSAVVDF